MIALGQAADASTFFHELGHFSLEMLADLAARGDAPADVRADWAIVRNWLGVADRSQIGRAHHEMFARGFEAWLYEGRAPRPDLEGLFARIARWLHDVYRTILDLDVELTADVRAVFARLVGGSGEDLLPGFDPVTARARDAGAMAARANARLTGAAAPLPEGGLFDETARAQQELFQPILPQQRAAKALATSPCARALTPL